MKLLKTLEIDKGILLLAFLFLLLTPALVYAGDDEEANQESKTTSNRFQGDASEIPLTVEEVEAAVLRFTARSNEFQGDISKSVEDQYKRKDKRIEDKYETDISHFEKQEMSAILSAIKRFEEFVRRFPNEELYTPDSMFRLAELYYQKSKKEYQANEQERLDEYARQLDLFDEGVIDEEPEPPHPDYTLSIALYNKISNRFPDYRYIADVYYLLAYCSQEEGDYPAVRKAFENLIASRPNSKYVAEAYLRIGDAFFNEHNYEPALASLLKAVQFTDSVVYDQILYKLASTYFILSKFDEAVETFAIVNDYSEDILITKKRHSYFRDEAVRYIAFCYAQDASYWNNTGVYNAIQYFDLLGQKAWEADVFRDLGDYFFQQAKWNEAVLAYKRVLAKDPWDSENPLLQVKIISIYQRGLKDDDKALTEREKLIAKYNDDSEWAMHNADDPDAVREARDLALDSLKQWATFQHIQAYKYRQSGKEKDALVYYKRAAKAYETFLQKFPHDKEAYELTFRMGEAMFYSGDYNKAVEVYMQVRDSKVGNKNFVEASYKAVLCYWNIILEQEGRVTQTEEEVVKQQEERLKGKTETQAIPELLKSYVAAGDFYVEKVKEPKDKEAIAWNSADIFYKHNHLDSARKRYIAIVNNFPKSEYAPKAAQRIIDTYVLVEDWVSVTEWSERLASLEIGSTESREKMRARLKFVKGNAMARYAMELEERKEYEKAAEQYLLAVEQDTNSVDAPKMLYNAAAVYMKAQRPQMSMKLFKRIVDDYPTAEFAADSLYFVAENAYDSFNLSQAAQAYEKLYTDYPDIEPKRKCLAMYNHAQLEEFDHSYRKAARLYVKYTEVCGEADESSALILFRAGEIYEKLNDWRSMNKIYNDFIDRYAEEKPLYQVFAVQAYARIGEGYFKRDKNRDGLKYYKKAIEFFKSHPKITDEALANKYTAQAEFKLVEIEFDKYRTLKIGGKNSKKLAESKDRVEGKMLEVIKLYTNVKNYRSKEYFIAASVRSAEAIEYFADSLFDAPVPIPREIRSDEWAVEEFKAQYEQTLYDLATPYYKQAADMLMQALTDARKAKLFGSKWMKQVFLALNRPNIKAHVTSSVKMRKAEKPQFRKRSKLPLPLDNGRPHIKIKPVEEKTEEVRADK